MRREAGRNTSPFKMNSSSSFDLNNRMKVSTTPILNSSPIRMPRSDIESINPTSSLSSSYSNPLENDITSLHETENETENETETENEDESKFTIAHAIKENISLYEKILLFEALDIGQVVTDIVRIYDTKGLKAPSKKAIMDFCDDQGILYTHRES